VGKKSFQILLLLVAVLAGGGIIASLATATGPSIDPKEFKPPGWLAFFGNLASNPPVERSAMRSRNGQPLPETLTITDGDRRVYTIAKAPDTLVRELRLELIEGRAHLEYQPKPGTEGERQCWPPRWEQCASDGADEQSEGPAFMVGEAGGQLTLIPVTQRVRVRHVE
jgi:hypothetical protein